MTTLGLTPELTTDLITEPRAKRASTVREKEGCPAPRADTVYDEQIQTLVQQLFFRKNSSLVRHVGFVALEAQTVTAQLCLDVAAALSESGSHDVGLIDARLQSEPLHTELQIPPGNHGDASWLIAPRLWLAPRRRWLDRSAQRIWDPSLAQLRAVTMEFDFSILCFDPFSWLTARLGQACNGVVMVLTAEKTRRLVALRMQEQLRAGRVPVLGTVLAERHFPVPSSLYRNL